MVRIKDIIIKENLKWNLYINNNSKMLNKIVRVLINILFGKKEGILV